MPLIDIGRLTEDLLTAPPASTPPATHEPPPRAPVALPGSPVEALRRRGAVRAWSHEPLDGTLLPRALDYAREQDARLWQPAFPELPSPVATVLAHSVEGLPRGVYRYGAGAPGPTPEPGELPPLEDLVLQLEFAQAPAVVVVHGDLATAVARYGVTGHRQLLARGAAFAHSVWLASLCGGAVGSVFAGVLSAAGRNHLGLDGAGRAQLLGLALGPPRRSASPEGGSRR
ncbi:nitroreductase family protein [Streptomyces sp. MUM 178J]|uniref:nitroreductase family protein n=1 Tax=Streptomyces sp. MUM 178J TaxID=2791991 RepID=UPI001F03E9C0|nr:nitroreductase family protein [Streptomyces sp. MUM 178J]WRQ81682.1 nitroreductase family protein [Streptomyces sp. MUM 178J]